MQKGSTFRMPLSHKQIRFSKTQQRAHSPDLQLKKFSCSNNVQANSKTFVLIICFCICVLKCSLIKKNNFKFSALTKSVHFTNAHSQQGGRF